MNTVFASLEFYFKGEKFTPSVRIDLDAFFRENKSAEFCYYELAKAGNIGFYSHELDVMMVEPIHFSKATGLAKDFVTNGVIDWPALEQAWHNQASLRQAAQIANKYFNVENIQEHPKLAAALMDAYQAGHDKASEKINLNNGLNEGFYG